MKRLVYILFGMISGTVFSQTIENTHVRFDFDPNTYALTTMTDKDAGYAISLWGQAAIWRVVIFDTSAMPPTISWASDFSEVLSTDAGVAATRSFSLTPGVGGQTLHLDWTGFALPNGGLGTVNAEVFLADDSNEAQWTIIVTTSGAGDGLWRVDYPVMMIDPIDGDADDDMAAVPSKCGLIVPNPFVNNIFGMGNSEIEAATGPGGNYPGPAMELQYAQMYDATSGHGLLFRVADAGGYVKRLTMTPYLGRVLLFWRHYPENNTLPNVSYTPTYDVCLRPLVGDWYDGAKAYRAWFRTQAWASKGPIETRADFPQAAAEALGVMFSTDVTRFANIAEFTKTFTWWKNFFAPIGIGSHLRQAGSMLPDPVPPPANLTNALNVLNALGIRSAPYTNTHAWPQGIGDDGAGTKVVSVAKTLNGEWFFSSKFNADKMCPAVGQWRQKYLDITNSMVSAGTTDQYCDLYPTARMCFESAHGHPLGGGKWWIEGYRQQMAGARAAARAVRSDFLMTPEHRNEIGVDLFDSYFASYWTSAAGQVFRGSISAGIPTPILAAVMHDYISFANSGGRYTLLTSEHFRFTHAYGFVHGTGLSLGADKSDDIEPFSPQMMTDMKYLRELVRYRMVIPKFLLYGEYLRPLNTGPSQRTVTMYGEGFTHPMVLGGAFGASDGHVGVFMTNDGTIAATADYVIARNDYGLTAGTYEIYSMTPGETLFYGGFRDADYQRKWLFNSESILMLEIQLAADADADGMSDAWETSHGLNPNDPSDALPDDDADGLSNLTEFQNGTDRSLPDTDGDGIGDADEVAVGTDPRHAPVCSPDDLDCDGDVDGIDFSVFASCYNQAGNPPRTLGCLPWQADNVDADNDGDVDGVDFTVFASCYNQAGNPPRTLGCPQN